MTFGRRDLKDIQEEVGRLLYSDTINIAARTGSDGESRTTFTAVNGTVTAGVAEPKEAGCKSTFNHRCVKDERERIQIQCVWILFCPIDNSSLLLPKTFLIRAQNQT